MNTIDRNVYGTIETNGLVNGQAYHDDHRQNHAGTVYWNDKQLARITRLRLLSDPGFPVWDVSYCHGVLKDGRTCDVQMPDNQLPKGKAFWPTLYKYGKEDGVYVKGILSPGAISKLN